MWWGEGAVNHECARTVAKGIYCRYVRSFRFDVCLGDVRGFRVIAVNLVQGCRFCQFPKWRTARRFPITVRVFYLIPAVSIAVRQDMISLAAASIANNEGAEGIKVYLRRLVSRRFVV